MARHCRLCGETVRDCDCWDCDCDSPPAAETGEAREPDSVSGVSEDT